TRPAMPPGRVPARRHGRGREGTGWVAEVYRSRAAPTRPVPIRTVNIYTKSLSKQASLLPFCTTGGPPSPSRGLAQAAQRGSGACTGGTERGLHKTAGKTGEVRVVYLSPALQELTRKLAALYPEGPLFRSTRRFQGVRRPWTPNGVRCRFKRLREKVA